MPRARATTSEKEGKKDGDECGLWAREEHQKADGASEYRGYTTVVPLKGESDEEGAECGGEHGFHAVELIALKYCGADKRKDDEREDAKRTAQPIALSVGGCGPGYGDERGDGEEPGAEDELRPWVCGEIAEQKNAEAP